LLQLETLAVPLIVIVFPETVPFPLRRTQLQLFTVGVTIGLLQELTHVDVAFEPLNTHEHEPFGLVSEKDKLPPAAL